MTDHYSDDKKRDRVKEIISPSGKYKLTISYYAQGEGYWDFTRGVVVDISSGKIIADVKRNYSDFWHCFVVHPNGYEYLLCGENYQGYSIINCDTGKRVDYLPEEAKKGWGFCWIDCQSIEGGYKLDVEGCYWGAPYEKVIYDFSHPEELPYPELSRDYVVDDEEESI